MHVTEIGLETIGEVLRTEFARRRKRNARYSLRAFARDLTLSPSHLSHVLRDRRNLGPEKAFAVAIQLGWSEDAAKNFALLSLSAATGVNTSEGLFKAWVGALLSLPGVTGDPETHPCSASVVIRAGDTPENSAEFTARVSVGSGTTDSNTTRVEFRVEAAGTSIRASSAADFERRLTCARDALVAGRPVEMLIFLRHQPGGRSDLP